MCLPMNKHKPSAQLLESLVLRGTPIRVYYGATDGTDYMHEAMTGKLTRTKGGVGLVDHIGLVPVNTELVVRIQDLNTLKDVFIHPEYSLPTFWVDEYGDCWIVRDETGMKYSVFSSFKRAVNWIMQVTGGKQGALYELSCMSYQGC